MPSTEAIVRGTGLDAVALKPREVDLEAAVRLPFDALTIDYEGAGALPSRETLARLADEAAVRVTVPVRADGFDPLGDDGRWDDLPAAASTALVAGNPAYLTAGERRRRIAPRLAAAMERAPDPWVGTEGIERLALATGATQFELLGPDTERRVHDLRTAGYEGGFAVYAPTVLDPDVGARLDALGAYVARRRPVATALPAGETPDATATGRTREVLLRAIDDYAISGGIDTVRERVDDLRAAGVDHVVGYPARGLVEFRPDR